VRGWADIMHEVAEAVPPPDESEAHAVQQPSVRLTLWDFGQVIRRACADSFTPCDMPVHMYMCTLVYTV
jgi:hypothetical protein